MKVLIEREEQCIRTMRAILKDQSATELEREFAMALIDESERRIKKARDNAQA